MEYSKWFDDQLRSTLDGFIWAVQQLPRERWDAGPPSPLGEWSAAQHVFHMLTYEQNLALPTMYPWLGAPPVAREVDSKKSKEELPSMEEMLSQFKRVGESEIEMLSRFEDADWNSIRNTIFWGDVSLGWSVKPIGTQMSTRMTFSGWVSFGIVS